MAQRHDGAFERHSVPSDDHRAALLTLLGFHALPVWGWGQRVAYERFAMGGPTLDHWVRTTGLWAEQERHLWEWEQMVAAITDRSFDDVVRDAVGDLASEAIAALGQWVDLVFLSICVDGLGEELARTLSASTYGPLQRQARRMVMYKRGQCADGCDSLAEIMRNAQLDGALVRERAGRWLDTAGDYAGRATGLEAESGWVALGLAGALDVEAALDRVGSRLRIHLEAT